MNTEQNKLEQDIKVKLGQREIQPTPMAWDRLDAMLSVSEQKEVKVVPVKRKPRREWLWAAAAFLVFTTAGVMFLNSERETQIDINTDAVVEAPQQPEALESTNNAVQATPETVGVQEAPVMHQTAVAAQYTPVKQRVKHVTPGAQMASKQQQAVINETMSVKNELVAVNKPVQEEATPQHRISVDANSLLAAVENNQDKAEIARANRTPVKVDSRSLLSGVEGELNESFRGKVLQMTIKNYNTVKTAVANRNYQ